jgi:NAD(P)H-flavin reductase
MNKKLKIDNFEFFVRLTEGRDGPLGEKADRWTERTVSNALNPYIGSLSKIYVCGPPAFNQIFDMCLESMRPSLGVERD